MSVVYNVINQKLSRFNPSEVIATDQIGFVDIEVRFEGWDGYANKRIQIVQKDRILNCLLVDDRCKLPAELSAGVFQLTIIGTQPNGYRATTNALCDCIVASGYQEGGEPPVPPTKDLYAQLLQGIDETLEKSVPKIGDNDHWYVWSAELGEYIDTGVIAKGDSIDPEVLAELSKSIDEIKEDLTQVEQLLPEAAPVAGKVLKVLSVNDDGSFTCEWAESQGGGDSWFEETIPLQPITLAEDVAFVDVEIEAMAYKRIFAEIFTPAVSEQRQIIISAIVNSGRSAREMIRFPLGAISTANRYSYFDWIISPAISDLVNMQVITAGTYNIQTNQTRYAALYQHDVSAIRISSAVGNAVIPAGTIIKMFAVR